ncbi:MAG: hypothetical protein BROFUL_01390 [Candidatus Brocadia fulgida]|uniref:Uncharacterized protein n=1 Tax=Candidatus Brocadia fulgida TaxID=380242 RepID=A0A0M2UVL2_9BACT|nr:MAG: hypothetical protein BROFUL_01390 [Candidatus Brocadia fulgida]
MKTIAQNEERRQPKIKTEMRGKGLTVRAGLLPVLLSWGSCYSDREYKRQYVRSGGANARYQMVGGVQMVVVGLIAGATSMVQVVKVWSDEVLMKMAGWKEILVDSTIGRIMQLI